MELIATYKELSSYIQARFRQAVNFSFVEGRELKVTYTKRVLIKDVHVSVSLHFDDVTADSVTVRYKGAFGVDMVIGGVLSFLTSQLPELASGIHPDEGHRIRINMSEIEKAKPVVENIELRAITPCEDGLHIGFGLKVS